MTQTLHRIALASRGLITYDDAAKLLGCSQADIDFYIDSNLLTLWEDGYECKLSRFEVEWYMASNFVLPTEQPSQCDSPVNSPKSSPSTGTVLPF